MAIDWEHLRKTKWADEPAPPEWPLGVRPMSMNGLTLLGIGPDGALYLDGERLALRRELRLTSGEKWIAGLAASGVFLSGVGAIIAALN